MRLIFLIILILLLPINSWSSQQDQIKAGNKFYQEKKWDEAVDQYFNALEGGKHEDIVNYNLGSAFYKKGDYDKAIENYSKALKTKDLGLNKNANYNLANAKFHLAKSDETNDINRAIEGMKSSLQHYDETLKLNPKDQDAAYNRKVVEDEIKRLEKKKQQQNQSDKNKQDQNNQQSKDRKQKGNQDNSTKEQSESKDDKQDNPSQKKQDNQQSNTSKDSKQDAKNNKDQNNIAQQGGVAQSAKEQGVKKQALQILNDYERQEAPKGLLHFIKHTQGEDHVDKDW